MENNYAPWTEFKQYTNGFGAAQFLRKGKQLQLRARALNQNATVNSSPKLEPIYSQLGRFVWEENKENPTGPKARFKAPLVEGTTYEFKAYDKHEETEKKREENEESAERTWPIASYRWNFGDGTFAYGETATHTFVTIKAGETITTTLTITDQYGLSSQATKDIVI